MLPARPCLGGIMCIMCNVSLRILFSLSSSLCLFPRHEQCCHALSIVVVVIGKCRDAEPCTCMAVRQHPSH